MDYYSILQIDKTASQDDIKKAFRRLAKLYHPDVNPNNPESEQKFKAINEAYEILSDEQKKFNYDNFGNPDGQTFQQTGWNFNFNPETIFEEFFGTTKRQAKNSDLEINLHLSIKEFITGCIKKININKRKKCTDCNGEGGFNITVCPNCNGSGVKKQMGFFVQITPCEVCHSRGKAFEKPCTVCNTTGQASYVETIDINIPENCPISSYLNFQNFGNQENDSLPPGNLFVRLLPISSEELNIDSNGNINMILDVSLNDWYTNAEIEINRFDLNKFKFNLYNLHSSNAKYVYKGMGTRNYNDTNQGDLIVSFRINK